MTELSPAAQAVLKAACIHHGLFNEEIIQRRRMVAAALRAAADQVVPEEHPPWKMHPWQEERYQQRCVTRRSLYIIAAELESQ